MANPPTQPTSTSPNEPPRHGWRGFVDWLTERPFRQVMYGAGTVALLVSGAFGGLDRTEGGKVAGIEIGKELDAAPVVLTITRVGTGPEYGPPPPPDGGYRRSIKAGQGFRLVWVEAQLRNDTDRTVGSGPLRAVLGIQAPKLWDATKGKGGAIEDNVELQSKDGSPRFVPTEAFLVLPAYDLFASASPKLTYPVAFVWKQSLTEPEPTRVTLVVNRQTWRQDWLQPALMDWKDATEAYRADLPVTGHST